MAVTQAALTWTVARAAVALAVQAQGGSSSSGAGGPEAGIRGSGAGGSGAGVPGSGAGSSGPCGEAATGGGVAAGDLSAIIDVAARGGVGGRGKARRDI